MKKYGDLDLLIRDVVHLILEEAKSYGENDTLSPVDYGYKMGLLHALSIMRTTFFLENDDKAFGLDFDLDNEIAGVDVTLLLGKNDSKV